MKALAETQFYTRFKFSIPIICAISGSQIAIRVILSPDFPNIAEKGFAPDVLFFDLFAFLVVVLTPFVISFYFYLVRYLTGIYLQRDEISDNPPQILKLFKKGNFPAYQKETRRYLTTGIIPYFSLAIGGVCYSLVAIFQLLTSGNVPDNVLGNLVTEHPLILVHTSRGYQYQT